MGHQRILLVFEAFEAPWRGCLSYHNWHFLPSSSIEKAKVICCFAFFPTLHSFLSSASVLSGRARKKQAVSSSFYIFFRADPWTRVGSYSVQASTVSSCTSLDSSLTTSCTMLCLCLKLCNQPLDALKLLFPSSLASNRASDCSIGTDTNTSRSLARRYHLFTALSMSCKSAFLMQGHLF